MIRGSLKTARTTKPLSSVGQLTVLTPSKDAAVVTEADVPASLEGMAHCKCDAGGLADRRQLETGLRFVAANLKGLSRRFGTGRRAFWAYR